MRDKKHETITDVIAEMRNLGKLDEKSIDEVPRTLLGLGLRTYANRLEAAHRREVDKLNSAIQATVSRSDAEIDRLLREVEELKKTNGELATLIDPEKIQPIELSKNASKNGADFGQFDAEALRDALKDMEATVTAALAHQPEDEAKCGQFLYDALVKCFNIADLACHAARTEKGAAVSREAATAENSSAVGNAAKLRDAVKCLMDNLNIHLMMPSEQITINRAELEAMVKDCSEALAAPPRNCDVGTAEEQAKRFEQFCGSVDGLCDKCELDKPGVCPTCGVLWAQWTYKAPTSEKEGGAE